MQVLEIHQGSIYNIAPAEDVKGFITGSQDQKFVVIKIKMTKKKTNRVLYDERT